MQLLKFNIKEYFIILLKYNTKTSQIINQWSIAQIVKIVNFIIFFLNWSKYKLKKYENT